MQAVILAAGLGRRLAPLTRETPKCLVEVNGTPIIANALEQLTRFELSRIVVVIGYLGEAVKERLGDRFNGVPVEYVWNDEYEETNNIYSLWLARGRLDQDTVLLEGDIYFETRAIADLFTGPVRNLAVLDHARSHTIGTMVEANAEGRIQKMIPVRDQGDGFDPSGKYKTVNIYSFTSNYLEDVFLPALDKYTTTKGRDAYYELVISALIYDGEASLEALHVNGAKWVEIDDGVDLERAERLFSEGAALYERVDRAFGGYWNYGIVDFSHPHNLHFPVPALMRELGCNLEKLVREYPSGQEELARKLSNWVGVDARHLVVGNGTCELISILKRAILRRVTIPVPSFNEYHEGLDDDQVHYHLNEPNDFVLDPDRFIAAVKESESNVAVLINPDLPSGALLAKETVLHILENLPGLDAFLLDESFIDFASVDDSHSLLGSLEEHRNLLILRSLSKDLGIPGLRLGYAAGANPSIIETLRNELPIWNINAVAEHLLSILPRYRDAYRESRRKVIEDRDIFFAGLSAIEGLKAYPSSANFILVRLPEGCDSEALKRHLLVHDNLLIKDCGNKKGLEDEKAFVRLAVRRREEMDLFLERFAGVVGRCP